MENMITRIQRRRTKGFRLPPDTVCVSRPGKLGNPFDWRDLIKSCGTNERLAKRTAVRFFRAAIRDPANYPLTKAPTEEAIRATLAGKKFVACWCKLSEPCHGDVLIAIACA